MHPLVEQLHFARSEFVRCLDGVSEEDGIKRILPMNCISWIIGHLALQERFYWTYLAQERLVASELLTVIGVRQPATTPPLAEMWAAWQAVTTAADEYLLTISGDELATHFITEGEPYRESVGTMLYRNLHHYWFHTGEAHAIRQQLGHGELPQFVGAQPPYRAE